MWKRPPITPNYLPQSLNWYEYGENALRDANDQTKQQLFHNSHDNRYKHCFWLFSLEIVRLNNIVWTSCLIMFSPEKWHPWRRICVPHWGGELLGLRQDWHLEWPEVNVHIRQCRVLLGKKTIFSSMMDNASLYKALLPPSHNFRILLIYLIYLFTLL